MGLDGFSIGNLGINLDMTSAQLANQSERIAQKESEIIIKDVSESAEESGVKRKEEDDENSENNQSEDGTSDEKEEEDKRNNAEQNFYSNLTDKDFEKAGPKDFSVKINVQKDMIELYSNVEGRVLHTISPEDMIALVSKLNNASGVLVNRKI